MLLVVRVRKDTTALLALKVDLVEVLPHVGVQLSSFPRQITYSAPPRARGLAKGPLAALLAESCLALTTADRLSDHVVADPALEEWV